MSGKLDGYTPRELLAVLREMARLANMVNGTLQRPAHGPRALRRRARRRRYAANTRRLERNGWRSFHEETKRLEREGSC